MTTGIYKLVFKNTNKVYIGQSVDIESRYNKGLTNLTDRDSTRKLALAYSLFGVPTLEIIKICTPMELDYEETRLIKEYDSYNNGFNGTPGGIGVRGMSGVYNPNSLYNEEDYYMCLWYLIQIPTYTSKDISVILNIDSSVIENIASCKAHTWLAEKYPDEYSKLEHILKVGRACSAMKGKVYDTLVSPEGIEYKVENTMQFAKEHNLLQPSLHAILCGKNLTYKGWHLKSYDNSPKYLGTIISPDGMKYTIQRGEATKFAIEHGLTKSGIHGLLKGAQKTHKGWKLVND